MNRRFPAGLGIPLNPYGFLALPVLYTLSVLHVKSFPTRKPKKAFKKREEKCLTILKFKIMHSKVFQITTTKVSKDYYLNECTIMQGDDSYFDYCDKIRQASQSASCSDTELRLCLNNLYLPPDTRIDII
jgi:hypothetical protein